MPDNIAWRVKPYSLADLKKHIGFVQQVIDGVWARYQNASWPALQSANAELSEGLHLRVRYDRDSAFVRDARSAGREVVDVLYLPDRKIKTLQNLGVRESKELMEKPVFVYLRDKVCVALEKRT